MNTRSLFEDALPEGYSEFQELHNRLRGGDYWTLSLEQAKSAYLSALCSEATTTFSLAVQKIMDSWTSVNRVITYIQKEFSTYSSIMSEKFHSYNDICGAFSDSEKTSRITQRLAKVDLDSVEIRFSHNGDEESQQIKNLSSMQLYNRFQCFWSIIAELQQHKNGGCAIAINEIIFYS
jgi:hypothetical protein